MEPYKKMYYRLFNGVTDALHAIEKHNYGTAKKLLIEAQTAAEELYISQEETGHGNISLLSEKTILQRGNFREDE